MNTDGFKRAGIFFDYCRNAVVPEIPYVQDVLFALRLSAEQRYYDFCASNHATYVVNIALVIAAVGHKVLCMERYDKAEARKIIAQTILDLTAPQDKCLFNNALTEAAEAVTGQPAPSRGADRDAILMACDCAGCKEIIREEKRQSGQAPAVDLNREFRAWARQNPGFEPLP